MPSACWQGLNAAVSGSGSQQPVYKLPKQPEFLFQEEAAVHRRSWSENLTFYTGSGYLSGVAQHSHGHMRQQLTCVCPADALLHVHVQLLRCIRSADAHRRSLSQCYPIGAILGGSRGAFEALRVPPPDTALNTTRLRLNRLLNLSGKNGRAAGHTLGVLGLFFSSAESLIGYFNDPSVPDAVNSVIAGICTDLGAMNIHIFMCIVAAASVSPSRYCQHQGA
jgi:mitochondrial import inner membrane translocase subunit TIM23